MTKTARTFAALAAGWLLATPALACPVCYGQAEGSVIDGAKLSVIFLGALVYVLIGGGIAAVVLLRRHARKRQETLDPRHGLHLIPPEMG